MCDERTIVDEHVPGMRATGVYVDVFPLDICPGDYKMAVQFTRKASFYRKALTVKNLAYSKKRKNIKNALIVILKLLTFPFSRNQLAKKINSMLSRYKGYNNAEYVAEATLMPYGEREIYEKKWFEGRKKFLLRIDCTTFLSAMIVYYKNALATICKFHQRISDRFRTGKHGGKPKQYSIV